MILADTSIWVDHLHKADARLGRLLGDDSIGCHPLVIEELAIGRLHDRLAVVAMLGNLAAFPVLDHEELMAFVDHRSLWGRGLSAIDAHLIGSVALQPGGQLWTRDRRMKAAAQDAGLRVLH